VFKKCNEWCVLHPFRSELVADILDMYFVIASVNVHISTSMFVLCYPVPYLYADSRDGCFLLYLIYSALMLCITSIQHNFCNKM